jgi:hypothetical protein
MNDDELVIALTPVQALIALGVIVAIFVLIKARRAD